MGPFTANLTVIPQLQETFEQACKDHEMKSWRIDDETYTIEFFTHTQLLNLGMEMGDLIVKRNEHIKDLF